MPQELSKKKRGPSILALALILSVVVIAAVAVTFASGSVWSKRSDAKKSAGSLAAQTQDVSDLIKKVARHIVINADENPTVGTVQDAPMLRKQNPTFYRDTQNGDRLLIWSDKAVLYSVSRDVILSVVPINLTAAAVAAATQAQAQQAVAATSTKTEMPVVEVLNGSGILGLGKTLSTKLKDAGFTMLPALDARNKGYATTTVFVVSQKPFTQSVSRLIDLTHAKIAFGLPPNEAATKADIIVMIGTNYKP